MINVTNSLAIILSYGSIIHHCMRVFATPVNTVITKQHKEVICVNIYYLYINLTSILLIIIVFDALFHQFIDIFQIYFLYFVCLDWRTVFNLKIYILVILKKNVVAN